MPINIIKILNWICDLRTATEDDIYELCTCVQQPGSKIKIFHDLEDVGDHGVAVVVFSGEGTNEEIKKVFLEAYKENIRLQFTEFEQTSLFNEIPG